MWRLLTQGWGSSSASWFPYLLQRTKNSLALGQPAEGEEHLGLNQFALEPRWYDRHTKGGTHGLMLISFPHFLPVLNQFIAVFIALFVNDRMYYWRLNDFSVNLKSGFSPICFVFSESCLAQSRNSFHSKGTLGSSKSCWIAYEIKLESLGPREGKPVRPKAPANGRSIWHILGEVYSWILRNIAYQGLPIPHPLLECELCWLCLTNVEEPVNVDMSS